MTYIYNGGGHHDIRSMWYDDRIMMRLGRVIRQYEYQLE